MNDHFSHMGRCISILDRLMKMYYDHGLSDFDIGWGQQDTQEFLSDALFGYPTVRYPTGGADDGADDGKYQSKGMAQKWRSSWKIARVCG